MSNLYSNLMEKFDEFPVWLQDGIIDRLQIAVKQREDENYKPEKILFVNSIPQMTYNGKKAITNDNTLSEDIIKLLTQIQNEKTITEITLNNQWTLEETSKLLFEAIEKQLCVKPENELFVEMCYLSGKIRIGEYLKRLNLIDVDQLEIVLRKQKEHEDRGEQVGFVAILEELAIMDYNDVEAILKTKQEGKKRYVLPTLNGGYIPPTQPKTNAQDAELIEKLKYENNLLKNKLRELLNIKK